MFGVSNELGCKVLIYIVKPTIKAQTVRFVNIFDSCSNGYLIMLQIFVFKQLLLSSLSVSIKFWVNYIRLIHDQVPVIRARLLSVLFTLVTKSGPLCFVRDLTKSQTISRMKSRKIPNDISYEILQIPNDISYEISQDPKRYFVRDLVSSRAHMNVWLCMRHEISYEILQIKQYMTRNETKWYLGKFFFPTTVYIN